MVLRRVLRGAAAVVLALDLIPFILAAGRLLRSFPESLAFNEGTNLILRRSEEFAPTALVLLAALAVVTFAGRRGPDETSSSA